MGTERQRSEMQHFIFFVCVWDVGQVAILQHTKEAVSQEGCAGWDGELAHSSLLLLEIITPCLLFRTDVAHSVTNWAVACNVTCSTLFQMSHLRGFMMMM